MLPGLPFTLLTVYSLSKVVILVKKKHQTRLLLWADLPDIMLGLVGMCYVISYWIHIKIW